MPFTPRIAENAEGDFDGFQIWDRNPGTGDIRLDIKLGDEGNRAWSTYEEVWAERGQPTRLTALLTDQNTGIVFHARRADCGLGCYCAAEITTVAQNPIAEAREAERQKEYARRNAEWQERLAQIKAREEAAA
jgi:hypothetical protein